MEGYGKRSKTHKMRINLADEQSIKNVANYFEDIYNIQEVLEYFIEEVCSNGAEYAKSICPVDKGDLVGGISYEVKSPKQGRVDGKVLCENGHAAYVEFGTGVVGESVGYSGDSNHYQYNVPSEAKDATGGWHYQDDDGIWHYTHGQRPKEFMYNTSRYMARVIPHIARTITDDK